MDGMIEPLQTIPFTWIHFHTRVPAPFWFDPYNIHWHHEQFYICPVAPTIVPELAML